MSSSRETEPSLSHGATWSQGAARYLFGKFYDIFSFCNSDVHPPTQVKCSGTESLRITVGIAVYYKEESESKVKLLIFFVS